VRVAAPVVLVGLMALGAVPIWAGVIGAVLAAAFVVALMSREPRRRPAADQHVVASRADKRLMSGRERSRLLSIDGRPGHHAI
jgi:hypothetical protein